MGDFFSSFSFLSGMSLTSHDAPLFSLRTVKVQDTARFRHVFSVFLGRRHNHNVDEIIAEFNKLSGEQKTVVLEDFMANVSSNLTLDKEQALISFFNQVEVIRFKAPLLMIDEQISLPLYQTLVKFIIKCSNNDPVSVRMIHCTGDQLSYNDKVISILCQLKRANVPFFIQGGNYSMLISMLCERLLLRTEE